MAEQIADVHVARLVALQGFFNAFQPDPEPSHAVIPNDEADVRQLVSLPFCDEYPICHILILWKPPGRGRRYVYIWRCVSCPLGPQHFILVPNTRPNSVPVQGLGLAFLFPRAQSVETKGVQIAELKRSGFNTGPGWPNSLQEAPRRGQQKDENDLLEARGGMESGTW
jgi:hypothetical protein